MSATVPSATALSTLACAPGTSGVTDLGMVLPGSLSASTADCLVTYGSSNDSAMLRMFQTDGAGAAFWRPGDQLDTGFDGDGWRRHDIEPGENDSVGDVLPLPDGTVLVTGQEKTGGTNDQLYLARYLADGSLDPTFGTAGFAPVPDLFTLGEGGSALAVQDDGRIVVGGQLGTANYAILRYTSNGQLDTTFNAVGYWTYDPGFFDGVWDIAIDSQGRIVAAAGTFAGDAAVLRLTPGGVPDTSFAGDGIYEIAGPDYTCDVLLVDSADRPLCAGKSDTGELEATVRRFTTAGVPDATFATGGEYVLGSFPGVEDQYSFVLEHPDGGYVLGGYTASYVAFTQRLTTAGVPDNTWDGDGLRTYSTPWTTYGFTDAVLLPGGGTIVTSIAIVDMVPALNIDAGTAVLSTDDGALRAWYDTDGATSFDFTANEDHNLATAVAVGPDGSIFLGGSIQSTTTDSLLVRFSGIAANDFDAGVDDWDTGTSSVFGACLRTSSIGSAAAPWSVDPGADCAQTDADAWRPVAASSGDVGSKVAGRAAVGGADASVGLRFGFRAASSQRPGAYIAPVTLETVAPNV